ncbi:hypothetical protein HC031_03315 [Planosporangium thailandense]|uniref:Leucine-rich repeat domain-containing protein n=1 Tax=Planosporangium thailandense TaxID=765197 RepID=A0ABX0XRX0_9ACTN|nr:hypothetical protein [Planosporangium thailandense]NJC68760.1 hypothetical protein [Planosporangium thailandense]
MRPLDPHETTVVLRGDLRSDLPAIFELLRPRPDVHVAVTAGWDIPDLDWLADLPPLRSLSITDLLELRDISGLVHHAATLVSLQLGVSRRSVLLAPLADMTALRQLYLTKLGPLRQVEPTLAALCQLEHLTLHSVTLADSECLLGMSRLRALALKLGGTRDLSVLPRLPALEFFEAWQVRGLDSVEPIGSCGQLRAVFLQTLSRVAALPDLAGATQLAHLYLEHLTAFTDLSPLRAVPALEQLWLIDMPQLRVGHLEPLVGHPALRAVALGLGSLARNRDAAELLKLPAPDRTVLSQYAAGTMGLPPVGLSAAVRADRPGA